MAQYVTKIRTKTGDLQIDYNALANLPTVNGKVLSGTFKLSASDVGASTSNHTHDDRYYTESEIDNKLGGKASSGHNHDTDYLKKYNLNAINIDNTSGNWTVDISDNDHGTVPSTWVNVTQTSSGHFLVQTAIKANTDSNANRTAGDMWIRDKYNQDSTSVWSSWRLVTNSVVNLWSNASSSTFAQQDITFDSSGCKFLILASKRSATVEGQTLTIMLPNVDRMYDIIVPNIQGSSYKIARRVVRITTNGALISDAFLEGSEVADNTLCIPWVVYGVK
jgi:hypothetical protein